MHNGFTRAKPGWAASSNYGTTATISFIHYRGELVIYQTKRKFRFQIIISFDYITAVQIMYVTSIITHT